MIRSKTTTRFLWFLLSYGLLSAPSIALSGDWQSEMVRLHNEARDKILTCSVSGQPPAKSMPHLSWHAGLAEKAQQLADQCRVGHDKAEERKVPDFDYVGQNWAGVQDIETAVRMWFEEHVNYDFSTGNCRQGMCGHYTQVVWASTTHIGCGVRDCRDTGSFPYGLSIVCNYGPAGNFVGAKPYEEGSSADCKPVGETNSPKPPDEGDQGVELPTESGQEAEQPGENDQGAVPPSETPPPQRPPSPQGSRPHQGSWPPQGTRPHHGSWPSQGSWAPQGSRPPFSWQPSQGGWLPYKTRPPRNQQPSLGNPQSNRQYWQTVQHPMGFRRSDVNEVVA
ncbi:GLIPR1-like protein 1 [Clonorchis sinensis]|uniref:GLIPR1-like protein 1 n=1 Tax=Clonorchis sinensis TaxID=79923 RepID=A0A3R7FHE9_CLOSI|nr:GLIPR1-like protein 1 [Clonorchis sinensis]